MKPVTEKSKARLPKGKRAILILLPLALVLAGLAIWQFAHREREYQLDSFAMGSYVRQTVWGREPEKAAAETVQRIGELEREISWRRDGDVAKMNSQAGGEPVTVDESTATGELLEELLELCERSGGALDITLGPVTRLWDFDGEPRLPDEKELEKALALVDYRKLSMDSEEYLYAVPNEDGSHLDCLGTRYRVSLIEPGMALDLGAVGKGAACDEAAELIYREGISGMVASVGGSVCLRGEKPDGGPFRVSVRNPKEDQTGSLGVLELDGGYISTSGSYEKYFEQDGKRYCHLLDPRTGYPAESGLVSVTVWCPPGVDAWWPGALSDGLATACFVLGTEDGLELLESYGAEGLFIDENDVITVTEGLKDRFTLTAGGYSLEGDG
ncbi:FAD:protein FMN transferase [Acutalibacter muris]|uniref:FAD:protein FMN transferase n=1 Tax=Acutalibacter muris TaxID=1796620 RepID=A0A1Z2XLK9_9FIRM|nr:hypothetical protein A4V00_08175 [Hungateiclostridiaceae bacterium KB18]ASB39315.1 FAD:protein FMN transferase [Acutalibacter muris]QQR28605.1 FAD:protein FMN transferase [Acutalibacter muris]